MHKKTTATETPCGRFFIYIELNYSAFKVLSLIHILTLPTIA